MSGARPAARRNAGDAALIAMLQDAVVGAAVLVFDDPPASQAAQLSEALHLMASDLVNQIPRLRGAYKGADR